jgi:glutamyl-tRNA reductase
MTPRPPGTLAALVTHARQVPATEREGFAQRLRAGMPTGTLILETCHRVEGYAILADEPMGLARAVVLPPGGAVLVGEAAVRHVVEVAVGRDSVVQGEDQVLHQLRASVAGARQADGLHPALQRLVELAFRAARQARSWHQGPHRSLADVALWAIEERVGTVRGRRLMVVGAGTMGRLATRAAVAAGAEVSLATRSTERARSLAATTGAYVEAFDPGRSANDFAGIIVALAGPWSIGIATIAALAGGATVLVDLSQPPAVPPAAVDALGPRLVTADALALVASSFGRSADASRTRVDELIDRTVGDFADWSARRDGRTTARLLAEHADREREAELAKLWRRHPGLEPEHREAIEAMTRHFAQRLLRAPLERLGRDRDGRAEESVRDVFAL